MVAVVGVGVLKSRSVSKPGAFPSSERQKEVCEAQIYTQGEEEGRRGESSVDRSVVWAWAEGGQARSLAMGMEVRAGWQKMAAVRIMTTREKGRGGAGCLSHNPQGTPTPTHSQMKVPWGMVCRARTPQPILAVR